MGLFDGAKGVILGNKAYRHHVDGNKLASEGKPQEAKQKYSEALRLYGEAVSLGKPAHNILLSYAILLLREGEFEKSRKLLEDLSREKNLSDDSRFQLRIFYAIYLWKTGKLDQAIDTMGRAAAYKLNGDVYGNLGMLWVYKARESGDFQAALDFNQRAMDYDDEDASTLDNMGQLYEAMAEAETDAQKAGEYRDQAVSYYRQAYRQKPRQITTLYYLARLFHSAGDDARARKLLSSRDTLYFSAICPITREMMDALAKEVG